MATSRDPILYDIEGAADFLSTTVRQMRTLVFERRIAFIKVGGKLRFDRDDLLDFLDANTVAPRGR